MECEREIRLFTYSQSLQDPLGHGGLGLGDSALSQRPIVLERLYDQEPVVHLLSVPLDVTAQERDFHEHRHDRHEHQKPEYLTAHIPPRPQGLPHHGRPQQPRVGHAEEPPGAEQEIPDHGVVEMVVMVVMEVGRPIVGAVNLVPVFLAGEVGDDDGGGWFLGVYHDDVRHSSPSLGGPRSVPWAIVAGVGRADNSGRHGRTHRYCYEKNGIPVVCSGKRKMGKAKEKEREKSGILVPERKRERERKTENPRLALLCLIFCGVSGF
jgi:hypothetical protein